MAMMTSLLLVAEAALAIPYGPILSDPDASGEGTEQSRKAECAESETEIVVCAKRSKPQDQRLRTTSQRVVETSSLLKAEIALGDGNRLGVSTQSNSVGGFTSNRVMVGMKVPLGKKRR